MPYSTSLPRVTSWQSQRLFCLQARCKTLVRAFLGSRVQGWARRADPTIFTRHLIPLAIRVQSGSLIHRSNLTLLLWLHIYLSDRCVRYLRGFAPFSIHKATVLLFHKGDWEHEVTSLKRFRSVAYDHTSTDIVHIVHISKTHCRRLRFARKLRFSRHRHAIPKPQFPSRCARQRCPSWTVSGGADTWSHSINVWHQEITIRR